MNFKECDYNNIKYKRRSNLFKLITEFADRGIKCAVLEDWNYANAASGARAINTSCVRHKMPHIKAVVREGQIFLVNTILSEV